MARVVTDDTHYGNIARQIRVQCALDHNSTEAAAKNYKPVEMMGGVVRVYEAGHNVGYQEGYEKGCDDGTANGKEAFEQAFWNSYQLGGSELDYSYAFAGDGWTDATFYPRYPILHKGNTESSYMFYKNAVTNIKKRLDDCDVTLDVSGSTSGFCMFSYAKTEELPILHFTESCSTLGQAFNRCQNLVTIDELWVHEGMKFNTTFQQCKALKNLTIKGTIGQSGFNVQYSTNLSKASIESIINALSYNTSGLTITLSKAAVDKAFESSEGAADGSEKGTETNPTEWGTLVGKHRNWTISLV